MFVKNKKKSKKNVRNTFYACEANLINIWGFFAGIYYLFIWVWVMEWVVLSHPFLSGDVSV